MSIYAFIVDYIQRHAHPVNAVFHLAGVPLAFFGIYKLFVGQFATGATYLFVGYLLQYLGHRAQGNEVGEVTLIKNIWRRLNAVKGNGQERVSRRGDAPPEKAKSEVLSARHSGTPDPFR
jgi:hypothetical protein